ncbi:MAG: thiazole synthase, partial [Prochlorococcus sp.]
MENHDDACTLKPIDSCRKHRDDVPTTSPAPMVLTPTSPDLLSIGNHDFHSRLFTGTGKYPSLQVMQKSLQASRCQMVTVAV